MKCAVMVWALAIALPALTGSEAAQGGIGGHSTTQSMDLAVTRYLVNANGEHLGLPPQTVRYRLVRTKTRNGWHTTLTMRVADVGTPAQGEPTNPFANGRVEIDDAGVFSMFDQMGRQIELPARMQPPATPALAGDWPGWTAEIRLKNGDREARLKDLQQTYGTPVGAVGAAARYVRQRGEATEELLVDLKSGLAREFNIARGGALESHSTFEYVEQPNGTMVRRRMRSEAVINSEGHRLVTQTEFSNVEER